MIHHNYDRQCPICETAAAPGDPTCRWADCEQEFAERFETYQVTRQIVPALSWDQDRFYFINCSIECDYRDGKSPFSADVSQGGAEITTEYFRPKQQYRYDLIWTKTASGWIGSQALV